LFLRRGGCKKATSEVTYVGWKKSTMLGDATALQLKEKKHPSLEIFLMGGVKGEHSKKGLIKERGAKTNV